MIERSGLSRGFPSTMLCAETTSSRVPRDMTVAFVTGSTPSFKSSFTQDDLSVIGRQSAFITIGRQRGGVPRTKSFTLDMTPPGPAIASARSPSIHRGIRRPKGVHVSLALAGSEGFVDEIRSLRHI